MATLCWAPDQNSGSVLCSLELRLDQHHFGYGLQDARRYIRGSVILGPGPSIRWYLVAYITTEPKLGTPKSLRMLEFAHGGVGFRLQSLDSRLTLPRYGSERIQGLAPRSFMLHARNPNSTRWKPVPAAARRCFWLALTRGSREKVRS